MKTLLFAMFAVYLSGCGQDSDYVVYPKEGVTRVESFSPCGSSGTQNCETSTVTVSRDGTITKHSETPAESYGDVDAMVAEENQQ